MIRIIGPRSPRESSAINTTSTSPNWSRGLSPFLLGPVPLYAEATERTGLTHALTVENLWQFAKVYTGPIGSPPEDYWQWAAKGWASAKAVRYPMGKGAAPSYTYWNGEALNWQQAWRKVYVPAYAHAVVGTAAFAELQRQYQANDGNITLWDFDGYSFLEEGHTFRQALDGTRSKGHAMVLAWLLSQTASPSIVLPE